MRINTDKLFFDPYPLALIKGFVYLAAYGTAICFCDIKGIQIYFNLIIFLLGFLSEFFELGFINKNKSLCIKIMSKNLFVLIIFAVIILFSVTYNYTSEGLAFFVKFFDNHIFWIKLLTGILAIWPLASGLYLMNIDDLINNKILHKTTPARNVKHGLGYRAFAMKNQNTRNK